MSYGAYFVAVWSSAVIAIPAAVALAVLAAAVQTYERWPFAALALICLSWTVFLRRHGQRVRIRSGVWPFLSKDDRMARVRDDRDKTHAGVKADVKDIVKLYNRPPQIVGGGWSSFLRRAGPPGPRLFTHNLKGMVRGTGDLTWYAGSTIFSVIKDSARLEAPATLRDPPTMQFISIGAWFALHNHGNAGDLGPSHSECFKKASVLDMRTGDINTVASYAELRRLFDGPKSAAHCILDVTFAEAAFTKDRLIQKRGYLVDSADAAAEWLKPCAHLRVLFVGAARAHGVGLRWEDEYSDTDHLDPHICSRFCQFMQVDVCSAVGGCIEPMTRFNGKTLLSDANRWMPGVFPVQTIALVLAGQLNFEVFFKLTLTGELLYALVQKLAALHFNSGGRCEIRYSSYRDRHIVYLDFSLNARHVSAPFKMLKSAFAVDEVALHQGKFTRVQTHPCRLVTVSTLMGFGAYP